MRDIAARELKGHNILAVERFQDNTRWMLEFSVQHPRTAYGSPGDEMRLFLTEGGYQAALALHCTVRTHFKRALRLRTGPPLLNRLWQSRSPCAPACRSTHRCRQWASGQTAYSGMSR